jgi:hypothetical protein
VGKILHSLHKQGKWHNAQQNKLVDWWGNTEDVTCVQFSVVTTWQVSAALTFLHENFTLHKGRIQRVG